MRTVHAMRPLIIKLRRCQRERRRCQREDLAGRQRLAGGCPLLTHVMRAICAAFKKIRRPLSLAFQ